MKKFCAAILLIYLCITPTACASWQAKTPLEKYQAAVGYYRTFSSGLHIAAAMLPVAYAQTAGAALGVMDGAIGALASLVEIRATASELEQASIKAAAAVETANAVVAVGAS